MPLHESPIHSQTKWKTIKLRQIEADIIEKAKEKEQSPQFVMVVYVTSVQVRFNG